jgi:hypothetical protein
LMGQRATTPYAAWIAAGYLPNIGTSHNYPLTLQPHGGNVGIGTTSPDYKLSLHGGVSNVATGPHIQATTTEDSYPVFQQLNWYHDNVSLNFDSYYDGSWRSSDAGSNFQIYKLSDKFQIRYDSGKAAGSAIPWNTGLVMNTSGNVGIGTDSPGAKLEISGKDDSGASDLLRLQFDNSPGDTGITFTDINSTVKNRITMDSTNTADLRISSQTKIHLWGGTTNGTSSPHLTVSNNSNVGIGFDSPSNKLSVNGVITSGNFTAASVNGTPADANTAEVGPGYINLARDDTAAAKQITFGKNGAVHSYLETNSVALDIGASSGLRTRILGNGNTVFQAGADRLFSIGSGTYTQGRIRQYVYQGTVANGATIDLFGNTSAHTDIHYLMTLEAFHSGRTYRTSFGSIGGYGWYGVHNGTGINFNNATVATGRQKLNWTNGSGFTATVYISALIFGDPGVDVYNGALSETV